MISDYIRRMGIKKTDGDEQRAENRGAIGWRCHDNLEQVVDVAYMGGGTYEINQVGRAIQILRLLLSMAGAYMAPAHVGQISDL